MEEKWKKRLEDIGRAIEEQGGEIIDKVTEEAQAIGKQAKESIDKARKKTEEILNANQEIEALKNRIQSVEEGQHRLSEEVRDLASLMQEILAGMRDKG